jgi:DNA-binding Lrp family transcriptional regulator
MDELDVKILRALISESRASPSSAEVRLSLRAIAARIRADDMTVNYRYKRLQKSGALSDWHLILNPSFFGRSVLDVVVDVQPESEKADMIRKLKLVDGVFMILNFLGRALKILTMYSSNESRSRTVELISRITNAERITQSRMPLPLSRTKLLTETDVKIIGALSKDARKSSALVAKELGLSTRTVRNRTDRLGKRILSLLFPVLTYMVLPDLSQSTYPTPIAMEQRALSTAPCSPTSNQATFGVGFMTQTAASSCWMRPRWEMFRES